MSASEQNTQAALPQTAAPHSPQVPTSNPSAPSAQPFVVPPVNSIPPAPFVQWQPQPPVQPPHGQPIPPSQAAQSSNRGHRPPQAQAFSAPTIRGPIPVRSREDDEDGEFGRGRKRLRGDQYKPNDDPAPTTRAPVRTTAEMARASAALAESTRGLAQPRDPIGGSSSRTTVQPSNTEMADADDALDGACQREQDEIMKNLYEGNLEDENGPDMRQMYRLVEKVFLKQDAILRGLRQSRSAPNGGNGSSQPGNGSSQPAPGTGPSSNQPPRTSPHQPPKKVNWDQGVPSTEPAGRQPRLARRVLIQKEIRLTIVGLLKLDTTKPKPPLPLPAAEIRFPTAENFGIRWEEKEQSMFNLLAAKLVVEQVCRAWKHARLTQAEKEELPAMVREHIRYMCRIHINALKPDAQAIKKIQLKNASAASRRQTLYESRLKVLDRFPELMKHRNLFIRLGLQGTSSDEEDPNQPKVYLIKRIKELSTRVQILKSKIDKVYILWLKGAGTKGSQMHCRVSSDKVSERSINVEGLPITCLNRAWFRSLSAPERDFYHFEAHVYDYSFPDELLDRRVTGRTPDSIVMSEDDADANAGNGSGTTTGATNGAATGAATGTTTPAATATTNGTGTGTGAGTGAAVAV
ncbi:hypothetical protein FRC12_001179 [Ceratobasidium sp. 428]|nr:hypothetical protein FRC12_001179 [Ceratobasidium sp. 428]